MVIKLSLIKNNLIYPDPKYGYQLNDKAILGVPFEGKAKINYLTKLFLLKMKPLSLYLSLFTRLTISLLVRLI